MQSDKPSPIPTFFVIVTLITILFASPALLLFEDSTRLAAPIGKMILFTPASLSLIAIAWTTNWLRKTTAIYLLAYAINFAIWNGITLLSLPVQIASYMTYLNAIFWLNFAFSTILAGRYIHWFTGIHIVCSTSKLSVDETGKGALDSPNKSKPAKLTIAKTLILATIVAVTTLIFKQSDTPYLARVSPGIFPQQDVDWSPALSGLVAGTFNPIAWLLVHLSLSAKSWRLSSLIILIPVLSLYRWAYGKLTASSFAPYQSYYAPGSDAIELILSNTPLSSTPPFSPSSISIEINTRFQFTPADAHPLTLGILSAAQLALILVSIFWLSRTNHRITMKS